MKLLFLTDPQPDYLADLLYTGLCKILGPDAVVDFPYKPAYHDPSARLYFALQNRSRLYTREEVCDLLRQNSFDAIVVSSPRTGSLSALDSLKGISNPPVVLVDGEDDPRLRIDLLKRLGAQLYFKREHLLSTGTLPRMLFPSNRYRGCRELSGHIFPLPLSVVLETLPESHADRNIDISYVGRVSHRKRLKAIKLLKAAPDIHFEGGLYAEATDRRSKLSRGHLGTLIAKLRGDPCLSPAERGTKLSSEKYYILLGRSKMALSIRGGGFDTLRYWEVVASKTLLVSEQPDIMIPHNFEHRKHAVFCRPDLKDLIDLVRYYRDHDAERLTIVEAGYTHLLKYHTCERRAEYFLETCRKVL